MPQTSETSNMAWLFLCGWCACWFKWVLTIDICFEKNILMFIIRDFFGRKPYKKYLSELHYGLSHRYKVAANSYIEQ